MRTELTPIPSPDLWKHTPSSDRAVEARLVAVVSPALGPITGVETTQLDDVGAVRVTAQIQDTSWLADGYGPNPAATAGTALTEQRARIAALGEAVERYCLAVYDASACRSGTAENTSERVLSPSELTPLSSEQLTQRGETPTTSDHRERLWTAGVTLDTGQRILIPAVGVYSPYDPAPALQSTTTGAATGADYVSATIRAFCECLEREAVAVGYYTNLAFPAVREDTLDQRTHSLLESIRAIGHAVILDATLDGPFPVVLAVIHPPDMPPLLGANCHPDPNTAVCGALLEAIQARAFVRSHAQTDVDGHVTSGQERVAIWRERQNHAPVRQWIEPDDSTELLPAEGSVCEQFETMRSFVKTTDGTTAVVDVTTEPLAARGLRVVKIASTAFVPLPTDERYRPFGRTRLSSLPVAAGYRTHPPESSSFRTVPHPFI